MKQRRKKKGSFFDESQMRSSELCKDYPGVAAHSDKHRHTHTNYLTFTHTDTHIYAYTMQIHICNCAVFITTQIHYCKGCQRARWHRSFAHFNKSR